MTGYDTEVDLLDERWSPDRFGDASDLTEAGPEPGPGERLYHAVRLWLGRALS